MMRKTVIRGMLMYFSEYVGDDEMIDALHDVVDKRRLSNYQDIMQEIRRVLRERYDKRDIPFVANYRRYDE